MTIGIIELNDSGIRVGVDGDIRSVSPGIAVIRGDELLLGEQAMQQSRLHPVDTNNLFWHRLSVEPLSQSHKRLRHHADLAYHQLMTLHQQCPELKQVVFAIPGSFTREQLSLLLGIVQECPFDAVGLIDSAVAASASADQRFVDNTAIHLELQLHQCLLTSLTVDNRVQRRLVNMVPDSGQLALFSKLAQFIADQFVGQSRFDPLHSANTDQQLYNQIPAWLRQCDDQDELIMVVGSKTIKLARDQLVATLQPIYGKILQQVKQLFPDAKRFLLSDRLRAFPGFVSYLEKHGDLLLLPETAIVTNIGRHLDDIVTGTGEISFLQSLPVDGRDAPQPAASVSAQADKAGSADQAVAARNNANTEGVVASHALLQHQAYKLGAAALYVCGQQNLRIVREQADHARCALQSDGNNISLTPLGGGVRVNHYPVDDNTTLKPGDSIQFDGTPESIGIIAEITA